MSGWWCESVHVKFVSVAWRVLDRKRSCKGYLAPLSLPSVAQLVDVDLGPAQTESTPVGSFGVDTQRGESSQRTLKTLMCQNEFAALHTTAPPRSRVRWFSSRPAGWRRSASR